MRYNKKNSAGLRYRLFSTFSFSKLLRKMIILGFLLNFCTHGFANLPTSLPEARESLPTLSTPKTLVKKNSFKNNETSLKQKKTIKKKHFFSKRQRDLLYFTLKSVVAGAVIVGVTAGIFWAWKKTGISIEIQHTISPQAYTGAKDLLSTVKTVSEETGEIITTKISNTCEIFTNHIGQIAEKFEHTPLPVTALTSPVQKIIENHIVEVSPNNQSRIVTNNRAQQFTEPVAQEFLKSIEKIHQNLTPETQQVLQSHYNKILSNVHIITQSINRENTRRANEGLVSSSNSASSSSTSPPDNQPNEIPILSPQDILEQLTEIYAVSKEYLERIQQDNVAPGHNLRYIASEIQPIAATIQSIAREGFDAVKQLKDINLTLKIPELTQVVQNLNNSITNATQSLCPNNSGIELHTNFGLWDYWKGK